MFNGFEAGVGDSKAIQTDAGKGLKFEESETLKECNYRRDDMGRKDRLDAVRETTSVEEVVVRR